MASADQRANHASAANATVAHAANARVIPAARASR
jgi:hypothetical protein